GLGDRRLLNQLGLHPFRVSKRRHVQPDVPESADPHFPLARSAARYREVVVAVLPSIAFAQAPCLPGRYFLSFYFAH
ncbi:hypothetical protein, partial [Mixta calida]|uniref:hypothetical protein n=1 Tax=Mixta calida TaxID=665913 RepID=UPI0028A62A3E